MHSSLAHDEFCCQFCSGGHVCSTKTVRKWKSQYLAGSVVSWMKWTFWCSLNEVQLPKIFSVTVEKNSLLNVEFLNELQLSFASME